MAVSHLLGLAERIGSYHDGEIPRHFFAGV